MKTPFDALVLTQKKRLEAKELEILRTNNQIAAQYAKIDELQIALSQIIYPKEGDFSLFIKTNAQKKSLINDIDTHRTHISTLKAELKSLQEQRRIIYIEYEKYKHIQEREKEKILSELKRAESKNLDEIALLLYNNPIQKEMI